VPDTQSRIALCAVTPPFDAIADTLASCRAIDAELLVILMGTMVLIGSNVAGITLVRSLDGDSWRLTNYPLLPNVVQYLDGTVGMAYVALSEEAIFRFYLMNPLLLRRVSSLITVTASTLIFAGIHWSYGAGNLAFATPAGLVLSTIFLTTRNLTAPIIVHAADDAFVFAGGIAFLSQAFNGV
jgi:membrane protease YdiL (CAAX protease family)